MSNSAKAVQYSYRTSKIEDDSSILFSFLWGIATFINQYNQGLDWNHEFWGVLGFASFSISFALILKPSSALLFQALVTIGALEFIYRLPVMPNHFFIMGIINTFLFSIVIVNITKKTTVRMIEQYLTTFRLAFGLIYLFATVAKFNSDFLFSNYSCAFVLAERDLSWLGINLNLSQFTFFPFIIAGSEFLILVGLSLRQSRKFAIAYASFFHLLLSLTPLSQGSNFSFVLYAFLILFLDPSDHSQILKKCSTWKRSANRNFNLSFFTFSFKMLFVIMVFEKWGNLFRISNDFIWLLETLILVFLCILIVYFAYKSKSQMREASRPPKNLASIFLIALIFLNGASPYLGIKTVPAFTMYSNLKTEGNKTNHLFLPRMFKNNYVDDLVEIKGSSNAILDQDAAVNVKWNYLELQKKIEQEPKISVSFVRGGKKFNYPEGHYDSDLRNINPLKSKFFSFRKVYVDPICIW